MEPNAAKEEQKWRWYKGQCEVTESRMDAELHAIQSEVQELESWVDDFRRRASIPPEFNDILKQLIDVGVTGQRATIAAWLVILRGSNELQSGMTYREVADVLHFSRRIPRVLGSQVARLKECWPRIQLLFPHVSDLFNRRDTLDDNVELSPEVEAALRKAFGNLSTSQQGV